MHSLPTCLFFEVKKELLVEDESHSTDFFYFGLCGGVPVDEVGCDGDCQFTPELLPFETWENGKNKDGREKEMGMLIFTSKQRPISLSRGNLAVNHNCKEVILG